MTTTKATRVVGYARVSTDEQACEGISVEAQRERIRAYCALRGLDLVEIIVDLGVSASKPLASRPAGARVVAMLRRREVAGVVAFKLDRLFRNCVDCLQNAEAWDRAGVALHLLDLGGQAVDTSSAVGRFFLTVMAGAAELERNQIRERTSAAMQHLRAAGRFTGGAAGRVRYGFRLAEGGRVEAVEGEQRAIVRARELRASGMALRDVAAQLAAEGHTSRAGTPFAPSAVARMLDQDERAAA